MPTDGGDGLIDHVGIRQSGLCTPGDAVAGEDIAGDFERLKARGEVTCALVGNGPFPDLGPLTVGRFGLGYI